VGREVVERLAPELVQLVALRTDDERHLFAADQDEGEIPSSSKRSEVGNARLGAIAIHLGMNLDSNSSSTMTNLWFGL
jgi:hypothetical protein